MGITVHRDGLDLPVMALNFVDANSVELPFLALPHLNWGWRGIQDLCDRRLSTIPLRLMFSLMMFMPTFFPLI
jgi:hypothetical protein